MGGYAIKENQSGQMGQTSQIQEEFNQGGNIIFPDDIETNEHLQKHINVDTPFGGIKVDTGNANIDIGIFAVGALLIFMFIYGKFFYEKKKKKEDANVI